jgi:arylsulfatase A-like enzyme
MPEAFRPPNIITIVLDCARAKNFATSGGDRLAKTPVIDSLAAHGTAFPRAVAPANWTVPSHFSLFTGTYPNVHGVRTYQKLTEPPVTTAAVLRKVGYETGMFTENVHLMGGYGLEEGFDVQRSPRAGISDDERTFATRMMGHANFLYSARLRDLIAGLPPLITPLTLLFHSQETAFKRQVSGPHTLNNFEEWLAGRSPERPFYAFFNFIDTHDPYDLVSDGAPLGFFDRAYLYAPRYYLLAVPGLQSHLRWEALLGGYLRSIETADRKVGELLGLLDRLGERERTLIILTADHGQSFGEAGNAFHGCGATDSVVRVPLVVAAPKGMSLPRRVERWVSLCDIHAWIESAASGSAPYDDDGYAPSLRPPPGSPAPVVYAEGGPASDPIRSLRGIRPDQSWNHRLLAAYRGEEKFVLDLDTSEVVRWDARSDPDGVEPARLSASDAARMRAELFGPYEAQEAARRTRSTASPGSVDVEIDERLRSWGYD